MTPTKDILTWKKKGIQPLKRLKMGVKRLQLMRARQLLPDMGMMVELFKRMLLSKSLMLPEDKPRPTRPPNIALVKITLPDKQLIILLELKDLPDKEVAEM